MTIIRQTPSPVTKGISVSFFLILYVNVHTARVNMNDSTRKDMKFRMSKYGVMHAMNTISPAPRLSDSFLCLRMKYVFRQPQSSRHTARLEAKFQRLQLSPASLTEAKDMVMKKIHKGTIPTVLLR